MRFAPLALLASFAVGCSSADSADGPDAADDGDAITLDSATSDAPPSDVGAGADTRATEGGGGTDTRPSEASSDAPSDVVDTGTPPTDAKVDGGVAGELVIMPFGDSITGEPHTYREGLYTKLTGAGCSVKFVGSATDTYATIPQKNHEGHPGFTIGNMSDGTDGWMASNPPKIVLMMIGTNDIAWWYAGTAAQVGDAHAKLLDKILADAPTAWVVVGSIPPESSVIVEPNKYDRAVFATQVNAEIKKRVDTRIAAGKNVRWADVNAALTVSDLRDGIHPTPAGYAKIVDVWYGALKPIAACLAGK